MPSLYFSSANVTLPEPIVDIMINYQRRSKVIVEHLTESSGIEPSSITLLFPTLDYGAYPCANNDQISVYMNKESHPLPFFRGFVSGFGSFVTMTTGQYVQVFCLDDVARLQEGSVNRDYNVRDTRDNYSEHLTIQKIAEDIRNQITAHLPSTAPTIMIHSFPNDFPGEMTLLSQPFNTALSTLLDQAGTYKYNIRRVYTDTQTLIYAYRVGNGDTADIILGTDVTLGPRNQPAGVANLNEVRGEQNYADLVNKANVIGDREVIETALALTPAWDTTKEPLLSISGAYDDAGPEDAPNPDVDPDVERIGRAYRFGKVNTGRFSEYPEMEPRLLQPPPYGYADGTADFCKPFIVYQFDGDYKVTFDFQVKDNEIITEKALVNAPVADGPTITATYPTVIYLEAAYRLRTQLIATTAKRGGANRTVTRDFSKPEFKYKYQKDYFELVFAAGTPSTPLGTTSDQYSATFHSSTNIVRNDTGCAQTWANARLKTMQDAKIEETYELPRMDLNYQVGQRIRKNGQYLPISIDAITYELKPPYKTTITAVSR